MNQAAQKTKKQFYKEIHQGIDARTNFANAAGLSDEDMAMLESRGTGVSDEFALPVSDPHSGIMYDDGVPFYGEEATRSGSLPMVRKPMYDALLDELERQKKLQALGGGQ